MVALASSLRERPVPLDNLILGEVGLTGEIRQVADLDSRLREGGRHGFARAVLARSEGSKPTRRKKEGRELMTVTTIEEAVALALEPTGRKAGRG